MKALCFSPLGLFLHDNRLPKSLLSILVLDPEVNIVFLFMMSPMVCLRAESLVGTFSQLLWAVGDGRGGRGGTGLYKEVEKTHRAAN